MIKRDDRTEEMERHDYGAVERAVKSAKDHKDRRWTDSESHRARPWTDSYEEVKQSKKCDHQ